MLRRALQAEMTAQPPNAVYEGQIGARGVLAELATIGRGVLVDPIHMQLQPSDAPDQGKLRRRGAAADVADEFAISLPEKDAVSAATINARERAGLFEGGPIGRQPESD